MSFCRHRPTLSVLFATVLVMACVPARVAQAQVPEPTAPAAAQSVTVDVAQAAPAVPTDGVLKVSVVVTIQNPAEYVEVRLRMRQATGRRVYQKTEVRTGLAAGQHSVAFEYDLSGADLKQGRYPIEVRVLTTDTDPTIVETRALLVNPDTRPLPVAIVLTTDDPPAVGVDGRFVRDPTDDSRLRDEVAYVTALSVDRGVPLAFAFPPLIIEQFARAASGYTTAAGAVVPPTADGPARYDHALQALRSAIETGTVTMVDVPYALPDAAGLAAIGGDDDYALHWSQTDAVATVAALPPSTTPGVAYLGETLSDAGLDSIRDREATCVLALPEALDSEDGTAAPGCYRLRGNGLHALVVDTAASAGAAQDAEAFYDALFARLDDGGPVVLMVPLGSTHPAAAVDVQRAVEWVADAPWLRLAPLASLARTDDASVASLADQARSAAPGRYWPAVENARSAARAYAAAAGEADPDAADAARMVLVAESGLWAGADGRWPVADEGLAFAGAASQFVDDQFASIRLDAKDVTLSGSKGNVPLTLLNGTGKQLRLTLRVDASPPVSVSPSREIAVQPTQNFLTIPVDLGNVISDDLTVSVRAGERKVAQATVNVRASYIDRLATVAMVIIVLAVLLVFIRRRAKLALADTIVEGPAAADDPHDET